MTTFDRREQVFEALQTHQDELAYQAVARRNKLLGLWVADRIDLKGAEAEAYAKAMVETFLEVGETEIIRKVQGDLKAKGVEISDHRLMLKLAELLVEARKQIST